MVRQLGHWTVWGGILRNKLPEGSERVTVQILLIFGEFEGLKGAVNIEKGSVNVDTDNRVCRI